MSSLKNLPPAFRPRERLLSVGATALTDEELLAVLLGTGARGKDALALAGTILPTVDEKGGELTPGALQSVAGVGTSKACRIVAALEFARRRIRPLGIKIRSPRDVLPLVQHLADRQQEHFVVISLNGAHEVIATRVVTIGLLNCTQVHPREVFADPLKDRAASVIVAHNHPSGSTEPSKEDLDVTKRLRGAAEILGIKLLDHVIFSSTGYTSLQEQGSFH